MLSILSSNLLFLGNNIKRSFPNNFQRPFDGFVAVLFVETGTATEFVLFVIVNQTLILSMHLIRSSDWFYFKSVSDYE